MRHEMKEVKNVQVTTTAEHTTDCFRKIKDKETGEVRVARMETKHQVCANLQTCDGAVFHNGARIA